MVTDRLQCYTIELQVLNRVLSKQLIKYLLYSECKTINKSVLLLLV